jgi:hypothetical protein
MMENYDILANFIGVVSGERFERFRNMHKYELRRMVEHGYIHNDAHLANVMINPSYPYFTNDTKDRYYGRAIIIDFGRAERINPIQNPTFIGRGGGGAIQPLDAGRWDTLSRWRQQMAEATLTAARHSYETIKQLLAVNFRVLSINLFKTETINQINAQFFGIGNKQPAAAPVPNRGLLGPAAVVVDR